MAAHNDFLDIDRIEGSHSDGGEDKFIGNDVKHYDIV